MMGTFERMVERRRSTVATRRAGRMRSYREATFTPPYDAHPKSELKKQPPAKLWHVTLFADSILLNGFKSRNQTQNWVLGGGSDDSVSFTEDRAFAEMYANGLKAAIEAAKPDFSADDGPTWAVLMRKYRFAPYPITTDILPRELKNQKRYRYGDQKLAFEILQQYSFHTRKFPLFMGGSFPDNIKAADPDDVKILEIETDGPEWWDYKPGEKEFRIFDLDRIGDIRIVG